MMDAVNDMPAIFQVDGRICVEEDECMRNAANVICELPKEVSEYSR